MQSQAYNILNLGQNNFFWGRHVPLSWSGNVKCNTRLYIPLNPTISAVSSHQRAPRFSMVGEENWRIPIPQTWPSHWFYRMQLVISAWIPWYLQYLLIMKLSSLIPISHYMKMTSQNISQHISFRNCIHFRAGLFCPSFGGEKNPARLRRPRECRDAAGGWSRSPRRRGQAAVTISRDPWGFPMGVPQAHWMVYWMEKPFKMDDDLGGSPILGNHLMVYIRKSNDKSNWNGWNGWGFLEKWGYPKSPCEKLSNGFMTWMMRGYHHFRQPSDFIESRQMGMGQN